MVLGVVLQYYKSVILTRDVVVAVMVGVLQWCGSGVEGVLPGVVEIFSRW